MDLWGKLEKFEDTFHERNFNTYEEILLKREYEVCFDWREVGTLMTFLFYQCTIELL